MHRRLDTELQCDEVEARVKQALHDALVDGDKALARSYRTMLCEVDAARAVIAEKIPRQREP